MKKLITMLLVLALLISGTTVAMATNTVTVYVDGVRVNFPDQKAYINSDNRTLVPVRFVSEALGADVEWNADTRQVNVKHKGQNITLTIGQRVAKVNTGQVTLDTTASITNDRTMVPLRFVSECLNAQVDWNGQARAVYITTGIENITQFVGKPMTKNTITTKDGRPIYDGILAPGEATPLYMYVTPEQLPIKVGTDTIFSIVPGEKYVSVKQSGSRSPSSAIQILYIQDGIMVGAKAPVGLYEVTPFTVNYDVQDRTAEALGDPRVDIYKVDAFAFVGSENGRLVYLIVQNPLNRGDWRP